VAEETNSGTGVHTS